MIYINAFVITSCRPSADHTVHITRRTDRLTDGWMDTQTDKQDRQTGGRTNKSVHLALNRKQILNDNIKNMQSMNVPSSSSSISLSLLLFASCCKLVGCNGRRGRGRIAKCIKQNIWNLSQVKMSAKFKQLTAVLTRTTFYIETTSMVHSRPTNQPTNPTHLSTYGTLWTKSASSYMHIQAFGVFCLQLQLRLLLATCLTQR